jgi:hypothetical protein
MLCKQFDDLLSDGGRQEIEAQSAETLQKMYTTAQSEIDDVLGKLENHAEKIAQELLEHVPTLPKTKSEQQQIITQYQNLQKKLRLENVTDIAQVPTEYQGLLQKITALVSGELNGQVVAVYLVGSVLRAEFLPDLSDIHFIMIINDGIDIATVQGAIADVVHFEYTVKVYQKSQFDADENIFHRFICYVDGQLLAGNNQIDAAKLPKPGLFLGELIAKRVDTTLPRIQRDYSALQEKPYLHPYISRELCKAIVRTLYAIEVTNNPQYTCSLQGIIEILKQSEQIGQQTALLSTCAKIISSGGLLAPETIDMILQDFENGKFRKMLNQATETAQQIRAQQH